MFQSLSRDSGHLNSQAKARQQTEQQQFQSLSRDSGHLNALATTRQSPISQVSIPQSGFGAFEPDHETDHTSNNHVSIPQSGFGAFEQSSERRPAGPLPQFQSLSRDSGHLNSYPASPEWASDPGVSIPQSGFGAFEQVFHVSNCFRKGSFNPSVGIRGI